MRSNYDFDLVRWKSSTTPRVEPDGNLSYKLSLESYPIHGGFNKLDFSKYINPANISAVFVTVKTQLILDNPLGVNDLASAKILLSIGADYYPTINSTISDFSPMRYVPAVGGSRFGLVKSVSRSHYFATIDPPGSTNRDTVYIKNGGSVAISTTAFSANMPPIFTTDTIAPSTPSSIVMSITKTTTSVSVSLSWKASTDNVGVKGYNIYRNNVKIGTTTSLSYKDTMYSLPTGALYSYTIRAFDAAGNLSSPSGAVLMLY